jgi:hypothetical protein
MNIHEGIVGGIKKGVKKTGDKAWEAVKEPVMNEIKNAKEYVKKGYTEAINFAKDEIFGGIKKIFVTLPLSLIPKDGAEGEKYKGLREFFNDNVNKDKDLGTIIKQLILAVIKAIFIILVMIPLLTIAIGLSIGPIMTFFVSIFMSFISFITSPFST